MLEPKIITADEQRKILDEKLTNRVNLQSLTSESNPNYLKNRAVITELCKNDFNYFADNFLWIPDPEADNPEDKDIPFLLYNYQEFSATEIIKAINEGYDMPIEKSRKMGLSLLSVAICVWGWHFHRWDILVGSEKASKVDTRGDIGSLLEKARYIIRSCPDWLIPRLDQKRYDKAMLLVHPTNGSKIKGDTNSVDFGRGDRAKVVLLDEFTAWAQTDRQAWTASSSTAKCRIALSTPNHRGKNCYYYQVIKNAKDKQLPYLRLHWTLNPIFAEGLEYTEDGNPTSPWYESEKRRSTSIIEVYQELDINYEASATGKVFPNFDYETNVVERVPYNENLPLYVAWDFGLDQTALLWIQPDKANRTINIIDEYINDGNTNEGSDIYHYIDIVESKPYKQAMHFGDPHSGENRSLAARGSSNANILRKNGIRFKSYNVKINVRLAAGRNIVEKLRIDSNCIMTIEMLSAWQFKRRQGSLDSSEIPEHNELSHIGDAFTYFAVGYSNQGTPAIHERKQYTSTLGGVVG